MPQGDTTKRRRRRFKVLAGVALALLCIGSVATRAVLRQESDEARSVEQSSGRSGRTGFLPESGPPPVRDPTPSEPQEPAGDVLPVVSEASFFALLGFALGYATRKLLKLALILVALLFVAIQGLSSLDVLAVDWSRAWGLFDRFVLNLRENESLKEVLLDRIPTAGALLAGYVLGFRRG